MNANIGTYARQLQEQDPSLPAYVMVPRTVPGTGPAYLGRKYGPFETIADPAGSGKFAVPNIAPADGISVDRLHDRRALLEGLDRMRRDADVGGQLEAADKFRQRAWDLLTSDKARKAFDLDAEPRAVRERYGFFPEYKAPTPDRCGDGCVDLCRHPREGQRRRRPYRTATQASPLQARSQRLKTLPPPLR